MVPSSWPAGPGSERAPRCVGVGEGVALLVAVGAHLRVVVWSCLSSGTAHVLTSVSVQVHREQLCAFTRSLADSVTQPCPSGTRLQGTAAGRPAGLRRIRGLEVRSQSGCGTWSSVAHPSSALRAARAGCLAGASGQLGPGL